MKKEHMIPYKRNKLLEIRKRISNSTLGIVTATIHKRSSWTIKERAHDAW